MKKTPFFFLLPLLLILASCSSLKLPGSQTASNTNQQQQNAAPNFANQPVEQKLAVGILKLEGTDKAVTAEQAKTLLPLWKGVKSLSTSTTASTDEINGLYQQIQEALTAEQVQAIKDMALAPEDTQALMKQYNIQAPQGRPMAQGTPGARNNNGSRGSSNNGGGMGAGGGMPPDMGPGGGPDGGGFPGGGNDGQPNAQRTFQPNAQRTFQPGQGRGMRGGGINSLFIDPVITLLQKKVNG